MKKRYLIIIVLVTLILEIFISINFINNKKIYQNNTIKINELSKTIENNFYDRSKYPKTYDYSIIDSNEELIYATNRIVSDNLNDAYRNKDTIVDIKVDNKIYKIIIDNKIDKIIEKNRKTYLNLIIIISTIQVLSFIIYYVLLYIYTIRPFEKMNEFAARVTNGNLDVPLDMDRNNNFGAFTEAFDIMRSEIKRARLEEKKAIEAKKELVAKLSHDIKSPIASIKSSSELGLELSKDEKIIKQFKNINQKSDHINTLITNLFNSTLEEMKELTINPTEIKSTVLYELIDNSDYLNKTSKYTINDCNVFADRLRLQQVFDNIYINSYKYANTDMFIETSINKDYLIIKISDKGDSLKDEELPLLLEKFKRGSNVKDKDGVGLGLYISRELLRKMNGDLDLENSHPGFSVIIKLRII